MKWSVGIQRAAQSGAKPGHSGTRQPQVHNDCSAGLSHCCRHCACCSTYRKCSGESHGHKVACTAYDDSLCHACANLFDQTVCWMQKMPLQQQQWERPGELSTREFSRKQVKKVRQASWMSASQDFLHRLSKCLLHNRPLGHTHSTSPLVLLQMHQFASQHKAVTCEQAALSAVFMAYVKACVQQVV